MKSFQREMWERANLWSTDGFSEPSPQLVRSTPGKRKPPSKPCPVGNDQRVCCCQNCLLAKITSSTKEEYSMKKYDRLLNNEWFRQHLCGCLFSALKRCKQTIRPNHSQTDRAGLFVHELRRSGLSLSRNQRTYPGFTLHGDEHSLSLRLVKDLLKADTWHEPGQLARSFWHPNQTSRIETMTRQVLKNFLDQTEQEVDLSGVQAAIDEMGVCVAEADRLSKHAETNRVLCERAFNEGSPLPMQQHGGATTIYSNNTSGG